jgi:hypothetical protein
VTTKYPHPIGPNEARAAIEAKGLARWDLHDCYFCGYTVAYLFSPGTDPVLDIGCWCVSYKERRVVDWSDVANQYNIQRDAEVIERYANVLGIEAVTA